MEIYIVIHKWDNGEDFEDQCFYEDRQHFSTEEKATQYYNSKISAKYIGSYSIVRVPLDSPESEEDEVICKTEYNYCPPAYLLANQEMEEEANRMAAEEEFDMWVAQQLAEME